MFQRTALTVLNHLLRQERWTGDRLKPFAGRSIRLEGGPVVLNLEITGEGLLAAHDGLHPPHVRLELPADLPWKIAGGQGASVLASARITGAADLAEALGFVFRNLRWDVEDDLSQWLGDVAAHRVVRAGSAFFSWQRAVGRNISANLADYFSIEADMVVGRQSLSQFSEQVDELTKALARLERRIS